MYLTGPKAPFRTAAERRALVGKRIEYLTHAGIDRSGRGYLFPRFATVVGAAGTQLLFENGDSVSRADLVEIVVRPDPEPLRPNGETP